MLRTPVVALILLILVISSACSEEKATPAPPTPSGETFRVIEESVASGVLAFKTEHSEAHQLAMADIWKRCEGKNHTIEVYTSGPEAGGEVRLKFECSVASERPASLVVLSKPEGKQVFIDGVEVGVTPLKDHKLDPNQYKVQVKWADDRLSETKSIRVRNNSKLKLFFKEQKAEPAQ